MRSIVCVVAGSLSVATAFAADTPPFLSFGAQPSEVPAGTSARLSWASLNADSCTASGDWTGAHPPTGRVDTPALAASATYTLTCTGRGGSIERRVFVNVVTPPGTSQEATPASAAQTLPPAETPTTEAPPTASSTSDNAPGFSLSAVPASVTYGGDTTLAWNAPDSTKCIASGAWTGTKVTSGQEVIRSLHGESRFSLTCMSARGAATREVAVTVGAAEPVTVDLSAATHLVAPNQDTTLVWTSSGADSCTASGAWFGDRKTIGSEPTAPLAASSTFAITCSGPGGTASDSVAVTVNAESAAALSFSPSLH